MAKSIKRRNIMIIEVAIYLLMMMLGILTMTNPGLGFGEPTIYSSILLYIIAFLSFGGYFITDDNRKTYELLFFSLICVLSASYLFVFQQVSIPYTLGTGFLIFVLLTTINKSYYIDSMKKENNPLWIFKVICLILLLFVSVLIVQNFYREISIVQTVMIGYYFVSFAFISLLEVIVFYKVKPEKFVNFINGNFEEEKKLKKVNKFNENVDKLDDIVKKIDAPKKIKSKRTKSKK